MGINVRLQWASIGVSDGAGIDFVEYCYDLYLSLHIILPIFSIILALYLTILPLLVIVPPF